MDTRLYSPKDRTELWNSMVSLISRWPLSSSEGQTYNCWWSGHSFRVFFGNQGSSRAGIIASSVVAIVVAAAVATAIGLPPTSCKYREALQIDTERVARPYSPKDRNER